MRISPNEYRIMELLWNEGRPLTRAELLRGTEGRDWNPASIHLILNSMISKGVIRVSDETKKYGRTYETSYTREEYAKEALRNLFPDSSDKEIFVKVMDAFVLKNGKPSKRALNDVQKYLEEKSK